MQQRSSSSSSRFSGDEHRAINIATEQQQQQAKQRRINGDDLLDGLPLYDQRTAIGRRDSRTHSAEKWIHTIPVLVLLSLFTLWWFSFPVDVIVKDGRITALRQIDVPILNDARIDLTILAVAATSPIVSSIPQNLTGFEETYLHPACSPN